MAHNGTFKPRVCQQTVNTFGNAPDSTEKAAPPATPPPTRPRATDAPERTTAPRRRRRRRGHLHELVGAPSDARAAPAASHAPTLPAIVRGTPPHFARLAAGSGPLRPVGLWGRAANPAHGHRARQSRSPRSDVSRLLPAGRSTRTTAPRRRGPRLPGEHSPRTPRAGGEGIHSATDHHHLDPCPPPHVSPRTPLPRLRRSRPQSWPGVTHPL